MPLINRLSRVIRKACKSLEIFPANCTFSSNWIRQLTSGFLIWILIPYVPVNNCGLYLKVIEEVIKSYDWQLEGKWEYASNNGNDFSRTLVFEKDGKGSYDDGTLEWYCSNNHLYIDFDNGKSIKDCDYLFYGATLQLKSPQLSYILDCPFIGSWLATDAHNHFTGSTFYYTFAADGNAECFTFNTSGIWESQKYSWLRTQDGIQLLSNMATKNLICEADAEKLTIQGDGEFSHTSPFYGKWKSVYSQDGIIDEKDENFPPSNFTKEPMMITLSTMRKITNTPASKVRCLSCFPTELY